MIRIIYFIEHIYLLTYNSISYQIFVRVYMRDKMSELKKRINYTVVCVNEFANKFSLNFIDAFNYLYDFKGIEFIKEHYDIEHTLCIDDAVEDLIIVCRNNGGCF